MNWLQVKVDATAQDASEVEEALLSTGALSVTLEDQQDQPILEPGVGETPLWQYTRLIGLYPAETDTNLVTRQLESKLGKHDNMRWEILEDKDWQREWMQYFQPIQCGDRLWVCPSWKEPVDPQAVNLILDPGLAFGTGTHPTTFLCLRWLDGIDLGGANLIDYGCGSGILAIAALLLGADRAVCVDNDPQALIATADNVSRNGLDIGKVSTCQPEELPVREYDVVVANILAAPLIGLASRLAHLTRLGGRLCLSGIIAEQVEEVRQAYEGWFDFDPPASLDGWYRLTATRSR